MSLSNPHQVLAIDYGKRHLGLAISDPSKTYALPKETIALKNKEDPVKKIAEFLKQHPSIQEIVMGNPLHMSGDPSPLSEEVFLFAKKLEEVTDLPVHLFDERLTSKQGDALLREGAMNRKARSQKVHSVSAMLILQGYLDSALIKSSP